VAPALLNRWGWPVAALAAIAFLGTLAFNGERKNAGTPFKPAGLLSTWAMNDVTRVIVTNGAASLSFDRDPGGPWRENGAAVTPDLSKRIETGLRFLRNSAPDREIGPEEIGQRSLAEFGLAPARTVVTVTNTEGQSATFRFGAPNPMGLARYGSVEGRSGILLLPSFVGEAWEQLEAAPQG
jgi:hypothetical protein